VFKKSDEAEWSRFSKALSKEAEEDAAEQPAAPAGAAEAASASASAASPSAPRPSQDVNVSVSRPVRTQPQETREEGETLIAERTFFDGTFRAEETMRIRGTVQGEVESKRAVFIEEQAKVTAKVTAATVTVAGVVDGQIFCAGRVEIKPTGRVTGEITAGTLIMQEGAFFEGNLKMATRATDESKAEPAAAR
jgi:cytoskeletal protein CcmA (bactofilin family)